ncbi:MAG TPA: CBS domain-containing protein [Terriglobia bacterium]|jgi:CBS domain-containing protein|nr:CBS domain-containing protein [Terriglobia bacterium]
MKVANLVETRLEVFRISEDATVHEAARYLRDKGVRAAGVCNHEGRLIGVISQSDISDKVAAENKCPAWMRVSEIMSSGLVTVPPEASFEECLRLMEKHGIYHLAVMDEKLGYRGMVSLQDLLRMMVSDEKARADMLEAFLFPQR